MYTIININIITVGNAIGNGKIIINRMEIVFQFRCRKIDQKLVNQIPRFP